MKRLNIERGDDETGILACGQRAHFHDASAGDPVRWRRWGSRDANLDRWGLVYMQVIQTESKSDKTARRTGMCSLMTLLLIEVCTLVPQIRICDAESGQCAQGGAAAGWDGMKVGARGKGRRENQTHIPEVRPLILVSE